MLFQRDTDPSAVPFSKRFNRSITFLSVLFILSCMIVAIPISYTLTNKRFDDVNNGYAHQLANKISRALPDVERSLYNVGKDPAFVSYMPILHVGDNTSSTYRISHLLEMEQSRSQFIHSIYFVNLEHSKIIAHPYGAGSLGSFYDSDWIEMSDRSGDWIRIDSRRIFDRTESLWPLSPSTSQQVYTLIHKITGNNLLIANINLGTLLSELNIDETTASLNLRSITGDTLAKTPMLGVSSRAYIVPVTYGGWELELKASVEPLYAQIYQVVTWIIGLIFIQILALSLWSLRVKQKFTHPIDTLCHELDQMLSTATNASESDQNQIEKLRSTIRSLYTDNVNLSEHLDIYRRLEFQNLVRRYLAQQIAFDRFALNISDFPEFDASCRYRMSIVQFECFSSQECSVQRAEEDAQTKKQRLLERLNLDEVSSAWLSRTDSGHLLRMDDGRLVLLFSEKTDCPERWKQAIQLMRSANARRSYVAAAINYSDVASLPAAFSELETLQDNARYFELSYSELAPDSRSISEPGIEAATRCVVATISSESVERITSSIDILRDLLIKQRNRHLAIRDLALMCTELRQTYPEYFKRFEELGRLIIEKQKFNEAIKEIRLTCLSVSADLASSSCCYSKYVKEAKSFIHANFEKDITVKDIADAVHLSYSHLARLFSEEEDCTILDYLSSYRVSKAIEILLNYEMSVDVIALESGFANRQALNRHFKRETGMTVSEYKRFRSNDSKDQRGVTEDANLLGGGSENRLISFSNH